jgi:hypothetical protein
VLHPQTLGALSATAGQRKHDVFARSRVALDCRSFDQFTWVFTTRPYAAPVANKLKAQWANEVEANGPALVLILNDALEMQWYWGAFQNQSSLAFQNQSTELSAALRHRAPATGFIG